MKIDELLKDNTASLDYMERYINDGSPSGYTRKNTTSEFTNPFSNKKWFNLYCLYYPSSWSVVIGKLPSFLKKTSPIDNIIVHPDFNKRFEKTRLEKTVLRVVPTSSARTVRMLDYDYYLKLNYYGIIGRIKRNLTVNHALASYEVSDILYNVLGTSGFEKLSFFPETGGKVVLKNTEDINMGLVVRNQKPFGGNSSNIKYIIPFFSLFSNDLFDQNHIKILIQLIEYNKKEPKDYILNSIVFPIIKYYFLLISKEGLQPEWHAQNLLLGLDKDLQICSFIMRDLESIDIDESIRESSKKQVVKMNFFPYKHINKNQYNYKIKHSFMFDYKLCKYLLEPIILCVCSNYHLNYFELVNEIKNFVDKEKQVLPHDFFPSEWYSFRNQLVNQSISDRPYINNGLPIYRSSN